MQRESASAVICGAGIAGVAAACELAGRPGIERILLVDPEPPLSVTSDKSTECYRNWWPAPGRDMVDLASRSIHLLESLAAESANRFNMNRRGYLFATADSSRIETFRREGEAASERGIGQLREHGEGSAMGYRPSNGLAFDDPISGCDLITNRALISEYFPCLNDSTVAVMHVRRCGWLSAQQLGALLLERAKQGGTRLVRGRVMATVVEGGVLSGVEIATEEGPLRVDTPVFVNAAGPFFKPVGALAGVDLPVFCEPHLKISFDDLSSAVDRDAPLIIWSDPTRLAWDEDEKSALASEPEAAYLLDEFPAGVHGRPDGTGRSVLLYWPYHCVPRDPEFPIQSDPNYPEVVVRGMVSMVPGLENYFSRIPNLYVDGGYYTKTRENRPLIGPTPIPGVFNMGALSGFGIMTSLAAAELLADHICARPLPSYADAFRLSRYDDSAYRALLDNWPDSGQL